MGQGRGHITFEFEVGWMVTIMVQLWAHCVISPHWKAANASISSLNWNALLSAKESRWKVQQRRFTRVFLAGIHTHIPPTGHVCDVHIAYHLKAKYSNDPKPYMANPLLLDSKLVFSTLWLFEHLTIARLKNKSNALPGSTLEKAQQVPQVTLCTLSETSACHMTCKGALAMQATKN